MVGHHPPDEAGKFACDSSNRYISGLSFLNEAVVSSAQPFIGLVRICYVLRIDTFLALFQCIRLGSDSAFCVALCSFDQQQTYMAVRNCA